MKKALKILGIILAAIVILVVLVIAGFNIFQHISYSDFYATAEKEFEIPGLSDDFVPQGLTFDDKSNMYVICGYMKDGSNSRIYTINPKTNDSSYIVLDNHCHAGGLTIANGYLFLCTDDLISIYDWTNRDEENFKPIATFDPLTGPAFIHAEGDLLYVGEFYIAEDYETDESHHFTTDSGDYNQAVMTVFSLSDVIQSITDNTAVLPLYALSICDNAQGMCILPNGNICISTSWGLTTSHIKQYEDPSDFVDAAENADTYYEAGDGVKIPLYYLDSAHLVKDTTLQPMSEELYFDGERILIMCESASNKYIFGKFTSSKYCYSFIPDTQ